MAFASFVGTAIEFYDFYIYGTAAALIFPHVFFPNMGPTMATISSLGTFAVAFLSRPIGAAVFGHFGDRLGRKKTLIATLLIMGSVDRLRGVGAQCGDHRRGRTDHPAGAAAAAGLRRRRGMGGFGAAERRVRASRQSAACTACSPSWVPVPDSR